MKSARLCLLAFLPALAPAQVEWTNPGGITARSAQAMAYDTARGVVVLFGGAGAALGVLGDTWEWDGVHWTQRFPTTQPPVRHGAAMAYDSNRGLMILFGGWSPAGSRNDTWAWTGNDWIQLAATGPDPRGFFGMAYDQAADRVVLFGGDRGDAQSNLGDTWLWDGAMWTMRTPAAAPTARVSHAVAYDATRQRVVLTGGMTYPRGGSLTIHSDCWEWDGANNRWLSAPGLPGTLRGHAMADDPIGGGLLAFGAVGGGSRELLRYDGTSWTRLLTANAPAATGSFGLAFDLRRDRLVLNGGLATLFTQGSTWEWDRSDWQPALDGPRGNGGYRMLYDSQLGRALLFGNDNPASVYRWDGARWLALATNPPAPMRHLAAYAFDRRNGVAVRFGGVDLTVPTLVDETWTFDGVGWQLLSPANSPGPGAGAAMAFDELRGTVLLFGGTYIGRGLSDETWEWNGSDWRRLTPATVPPARQNSAMVWDRLRARMVMFGGNTGASDTWEWDGNDWLPTSPAQSPPGAYLLSLAYDEARQRVVLFGPGSTGSDEHWEWDGVDWHQRTPRVRPNPRNDFGMTYDETRRRVVLFGGTQQGVFYTDTWELASEVEGAYLLLGPGCGGGGAVPQLNARFARQPWAGEGFPVEVAPLPPGSPGAAILFGTSRTSWLGLPLPLDLAPIGAPGCPLRVSVDLSAPMATTGAAATHTVVIPTQRVLLGRSFFQQALVLAPGANGLGAVMSSAREAVIGTR